MRKILVFSCFIFFTNLEGNCQIEKGNWLLGGSARFRSYKHNSDLGNVTSRNIDVNGNIGYFLKDKFSCGLRPDVNAEKIKTSSTNSWATVASVGPFARYYFLSPSVRTNVFLESHYAYGWSITKYQRDNWSEYGFAAGPVIFLNSAVALELSVGYFKSIGEGLNRSKVFTTGIGLQFHLTKDD